MTENELYDELKNNILAQYGEDTFNKIKFILMKLQSNYKFFFNKTSKLEKIIQTEDWCDAFSNIPIKALKQAYQNYRLLNKSYPPTIAHINLELYNMIETESYNADESFDKIYELVGRYGTKVKRYEIAREEFSEFEKKFVTYAKWKDIGLSEDSKSVRKGQYVRSYNLEKEKVITNKRKTLNTLKGEFLTYEEKERIE